ncbi:MAG: TolC family protein [Mariprofundaceae bacterium]
MAALAWMLVPMAALAAPADPLTLQAAERLALAGNARLAAEQARARALAEIPAQAGSLPDPVISLGALNLPADSWSLTQENMTQIRIGVSQAFPFPGKLDLAREAAEQRAMAADEMVAERRLRLLRDVRLHWWRLWWLDKAIRLVRRNQALLRGLVRTAETRYATGQGLQQDVLLAQLELSNLSERERDLVAARHRTAAAMNALIGRRADAMILIQENTETTPEGIQPPDGETLKRLARKRRPLLVALARRAAAAKRETELAEKDEWPDFRLDAGWGFRSGVNPASGRTRADLASITLSMSVPLYAGSKQDRRVAQRKAEHAGTELDRQDAIWRVDAEIEAALADWNSARDRARLFAQGILPQARQTTASMLAGYQTGKVDFLNLVRAQLAGFDAEIRYWREVSRQQQAIARLLAASGAASTDEWKAHGKHTPMGDQS